MSGCIGISKSSKLVPTNGYLQAPDNKYEFRTSDRLIKRFDRVTWALKGNLYSKDRDVLVILRPFSRYNFLQIFSLKNDEKILVDHSDSFYQVNDSAKKKLIVGENGMLNKGWDGGLTIFDSENAYYKYFAQESLILEAEIGDRVRYRIPFEVGNRQYLIDVTTKDRRLYRPKLILPGPSSP